MKEYQHQEFPRYLHHHEKESVLVGTPEEQDALGDGWHKSKAEAVAHGLKLKKDAEDLIERLKKEAEEKGVCHACGQPLPEAQEGEGEKDTQEAAEGSQSPALVEGIGEGAVPRRFQRRLPKA